MRLVLFENICEIKTARHVQFFECIPSAMLCILIKPDCKPVAGENIHYIIL